MLNKIKRYIAAWQERRQAEKEAKEKRALIGMLYASSINHTMTKKY